MNISKHLFALCFLGTASVFAQFTLDFSSSSAEGASGSSSFEENAFADTSYVPEPQPPSPPPPPVSKPEQSPAPEGKTVFDILRGHAYNPFAIAGAASTVEDLVTIPSDISGQKFIYVSPSDNLGYTAFDLIGGSVLLGLDSDPNLAALILGYANSAFGIALKYSVNKDWNTMDNNAGTSNERNTYPGDNMELYFSLPIGSAAFYANVGWLTNRHSRFLSVEGGGSKNEQTVDYSTKRANVGLLGNAGSLNYDAYMNITRISSAYTNNDGDLAIDPEDTRLNASLNINLGYAALQSQTARVIAGSNNRLGISFLDKIGDNIKGDNIMYLTIAPNILGEVVLFENWLAFAGARHYVNFQFGDGDRDEDTDYTEISHSDRTLAFAGIRYQRVNWALEAQVSANPFEALAGTNVFANFGGFIYF